MINYELQIFFSYFTSSPLPHLPHAGEMKFHTTFEKTRQHLFLQTFSIFGLCSTGHKNLPKLEICNRLSLMSLVLDGVCRFFGTMQIESSTNPR